MEINNINYKYIYKYKISPEVVIHQDKRVNVSTSSILTPSPLSVSAYIRVFIYMTVVLTMDIGTLNYMD